MRTFKVEIELQAPADSTFTAGELREMIEAALAEWDFSDKRVVDVVEITADHDTGMALLLRLEAAMADAMDFEPDDRTAAQRSLMAARHRSRAREAAEAGLWSLVELEARTALEYLEGNR